MEAERKALKDGFSKLNEVCLFLSFGQMVVLRRRSTNALRSPHPIPCQVQADSDHLYGDGMTPIAISSADSNDTELVEQSLAGDRQAFGQIVARYQSLVCALAYSATGSRSHSEDLAQDTFLAAWLNLRDLH